MHMADALISPQVGTVMWATTAITTAYCVKKLKDEAEENKIPMMGVMGAFVFASQMINFSIPGTGSSGHFAGGLLLSIILGPYAGFLTMGVILLIQALVFADGGLLAYGCNVFNLAFWTSFVVYPFMFKKIAKDFKPKNVLLASLISAILGLQLGAFSVVIETTLSGKTELPFGTFLLFMQPIHLAIGIVEGFITAAVANFILKVKPEILMGLDKKDTSSNTQVKNVVITFLILAIIIGGFISWFASSNPDGLEWSIGKIMKNIEIETNSKIHNIISSVQEKISLLPDYNFKKANNDSVSQKMGTSISGIIGGLITLIVSVLIGFITIKLKKLSNKKW